MSTRDLSQRVRELEARVEYLRADLATLRTLVDRDSASALNKIRFVTEKILLRLCRDHDISWGKAEPTLERMIGPLVAREVIPRNVAIHVRTIQNNASPGSHFQESALTETHVHVAQLALLEFIEWTCRADGPSLAVGGVEAGIEAPLRPGGEIVVLQEQYNETLDPLDLSPDDVTVAHHLFEPLFHIDSLSGELLPCLATHWELGERGFLVELRDGVRFHDGSPLDADAVAACLRRVFDDEHGRLVYGDVTRVEASGDRTLALHLDQISASLPYRLTHIMARITKPGPEFPSGTGPFTLRTWNPTMGAVVLEPNRDYWGPPPGVDRVVFKTIEEVDQRLEKLRTTPNSLSRMSPQHLGDPPADLGQSRVLDTSTTACVSLFPNAKRAFLGEPRHRRAVALALDYARIVRELYQGHARPATGFVPPGLGMPQTKIPLFKRDLERARAFLDGADLPERPLTLLLMADQRPSTPDPELAAALFSEFLSDIGIRVEPEFLPVSDFVEELRSGTHDLAYCATTPDFPDPEGYFQFYTRAGIENGWNFSHFVDAECDELLARSQRELNHRSRMGCFRKLERRFRDLVPVIPVAQISSMLLAGEAIEGVEVSNRQAFGHLFSLHRARVRSTDS